jgi:hypothetical protein
MSEKSKTPAELRAMAQRARALAHDVPDDVMSAQLLEIAGELEAQANAQERHDTHLREALLCMKTMIDYLSERMEKIRAHEV